MNAKNKQKEKSNSKIMDRCFYRSYFCSVSQQQKTDILVFLCEDFRSNGWKTFIFIVKKKRNRKREGKKKERKRERRRGEGARCSFIPQAVCQTADEHSQSAHLDGGGS